MQHYVIPEALANEWQVPLFLCRDLEKRNKTPISLRSAYRRTRSAML